MIAFKIAIVHMQACEKLALFGVFFSAELPTPREETLFVFNQIADDHHTRTGSAADPLARG